MKNLKLVLIAGAVAALATACGGTTNKTDAGAGGGHTGGGVATGGGTGTGGGTATGGGTGTGGGVPTGTWDGGCSTTRTFATLDQTNVGSMRWQQFSDGSVWNRVRFNVDPSNGGTYLYQQIYVDPANPPTLPLVTTASATDNWYATFTLGKGTGTGLTTCDPVAGTCTKRYLNLGGTMTWDSVGGDVTGQLKGSAANLHFVAWDFVTQTLDDGGVGIARDEASVGADCIDVGTWTFNVVYTAFADGGVAWDAGM